MMKKPFLVSAVVAVFAFVLLMVPVKADSTNLCPMPNGWTTSHTGMSLGIGGVSNVVLDTVVKYNDASTLRIDPIGSSSNDNREANSYYLPVNVGDNITFSLWMKLSATPSGETDRGARFGLDFYGANGRIVGAQTPDGDAWNPDDGWSDEEDDQFVSWGTTTWTKKTMTFIVNATYSADYWANPAYSLGEAVEPVGVIPWLQACSSVDGGQAWFADTQFFINPETEPTPSPTPTPTPTPTSTTTATPTLTPPQTTNPTPSNSNLVLVVAPLMTLAIVGLFASQLRRVNL